VRREIFLRRAHLPACEGTHEDESTRSEALIARWTRNALRRNSLISLARRKRRIYCKRRPGSCGQVE
jgi:hypothetical protein